MCTWNKQKTSSSNMHHSLYCPTYSLFHIFHFPPLWSWHLFFPLLLRLIWSFYLQYDNLGSLSRLKLLLHPIQIQQVLGKYQDSWFYFFLYFLENTCVLSQNSKKSFENFKSHLYIFKWPLMAFSECCKSLILSGHRDDFVAKGNFNQTITLCPTVENICPFQI